MFLNRGKRFILLSLLSLLFVCSQIVIAQDKDWREVTPAELEMKTPRVEAGCRCGSDFLGSSH